MRYPPVGEIKSGTGTIQIKGSAEFAPVIPGPHNIYFQNKHQTDISVYLINAYVPKSSAIQITRQKRDVRQTETWVDFSFVPGVVVPLRPAAGLSAPLRPGL